MVQKICPICDQVMHGRHYCRTCRRWVKDPYVRDVTYYLNERHPADERGCTYHNADNHADEVRTGAGQGSANTPWSPKPAVGQKPAGVQKSAGVQKLAGSQKPSGSQGAAAQSTRPAKAQRPAKSQKSKNKNWGIPIVVVIFVLFKVVPLLTSWSIHTIENMVSETSGPEYDVDMGGFYGEEESWDTDYQELEDDVVIAAGQQCNGTAHFDISREEMCRIMEILAEEYGLTVEEGMSYSYNEAYENGATWYATWVDYAWKDEDGNTKLFIEMDCDTATGALHEIDITVEQPEQLKTAAKDMLDLLEAHGAMSGEENCASVVEEELIPALSDMGTYHIQSGTVCVSGYSQGDTCTVYIYRETE